MSEETTKNTMTRWRLTGTVLALLILASLPLVIFSVALGFASFSAISQGWFFLYSTIVLMAATWTFGKETLEAVQKARGK